MQQRIPNETLSGLATTVAEGPIFEIVEGLTEVQQAVEKKLFKQRLELVKQHSGFYPLVFVNRYSINLLANNLCLVHCKHRKIVNLPSAAETR